MKRAPRPDWTDGESPTLVVAILVIAVFGMLWGSELLAWALEAPAG